MKNIFSNNQKKIIIFSCMLLQAIPFGIAQNIPPLFIEHLVDTYHFSVQSVGYIFTIGAIAASLIAPISGKFYSKYSVKLIMLCGLICSALGVMLNAIASNLGMFLFASAITQIGTVTFSGLGVPYLIGSWFSDKEKATALGIAFSGGSIGNFFLQPIVVKLLSMYHLHFVYFICGLVSLVVGVTIILLFIKKNTHNVTQEEQAKEQKQIVEKGIGYKKTVKYKSFWLLSIAFFIIGLAIAALSSQYANFFSAIKINSAVIGIIGSTFAISFLLGNVFGGILFSKLGVFKTMSIAAVLQISAVLAMLVSIFNPQLAVPCAFLWAILYGLNVFSYMSGPAIMIQNLFGMKDSSQILGVFSIFFAVGFAIGNIIFGFFVDSFGFTIAWINELLIVVIGFAGLLTLIKKIMRKKFQNLVLN
ncbi:conjugated bile salt MFS transporter [Enterococcus faecalis]|uniref:conjugated bile salt MFS transporter n=1 Tax=Enterococcus faecalis TaxID=1351 RepID=UPI0025B086A5|nr:conjugated bile salt MFS transporter [Enterococcus faecalis]MDN3202455.1 conjugated bile salt MFS transporter [Enterococcus faecalis]